MIENVKICPSCGKEITGHPALSRRDNKTKICSKCGTLEAIVDYDTNRNQPPAHSNTTFI